MARVTRANWGVPPMAAMSLTLMARAFHPRSRHGASPGGKCTPSTSVSVVASTTESPKRQAAVSSPMPTMSDSGRVAPTAAASRSMSPNSPRSETFTGPLYGVAHCALGPRRCQWGSARLSFTTCSPPGPRGLALRAEERRRGTRPRLPRLSLSQGRTT